MKSGSKFFNNNSECIRSLGSLHHSVAGLARWFMGGSS